MRPGCTLEPPGMLLALLMLGQQELTSECFQYAAEVKNPSPSCRYLLWEFLTSSPVSIVGKNLIISVASKIIAEIGGRKIKAFRPGLELNGVPRRFMSTQNLGM